MESSQGLALCGRAGVPDESPEEAIGKSEAQLKKKTPEVWELG